MKKNNTKKLYFNSLSVTELNISQMRRIIAGEGATISYYTQTGPPDKFSTMCADVSPTTTTDVKYKK